MRIMCPNCSAQYEVPKEVMPEEGRDVQCSNCGTTWFQHHPDFPPGGVAAPTPQRAAPAPSPPVEEPVRESHADVEPPVGQEVEIDPAPVEREYADAPEETPHGSEPDVIEGDVITDEEVPPPRSSQRQLDPEVETILRAEALREAEARARETSSGLETQPELGLTQRDRRESAAHRAGHARERMLARRDAELTPHIPDAPAEPVEDTKTARRDALPDVEALNRTILTKGTDTRSDRPTTQRAQKAQPKPKKRGFRTGFYLALLGFGCATAAYLLNADLARAVPAAAPYLQDFATWVDGLRLQLDGQVQTLLNALDEMTKGPDEI